MKKWKTTIVLLMTVVGVGAYISLYELRQPPQAARARLAREVLRLAPETVSQLTVDTPQASVVLQRDETTWRLQGQQPDRFRADPELIDRVLGATASLIAERILEPSAETPLDPAAYGLEPGLAKLMLQAGAATTTLRFGEATPVPGFRYAKLESSPEIFLLHDGLFEAIDRPPDEFRDTRLIRLTSWLVNEVAVTSPASRFTLVRSEADWSLRQPIEDQASRTEVNAFLDRLSRVEIRRFLQEAPPVDSGTPMAEMVIVQENGASTITLRFGPPIADDDTLLWAWRSDEPSFPYAVHAGELQALLRDPNSFRNKQCFQFFASDVTRVGFSDGEANWTVERRDDQWQVMETGASLTGQTVNAWVNRLADLRLSGFVDDQPQDLGSYGLEPPATVFTVWTEGVETPQRLLVGEAVEDSDARYGRIEGRQAIVRLPPVVSDLRDFILRSVQPAPDAPAQTAPAL